jgi:hypothetical protein
MALITFAVETFGFLVMITKTCLNHCEECANSWMATEGTSRSKQEIIGAGKATRGLKIDRKGDQGQIFLSQPCKNYFQLFFCITTSFEPFSKELYSSRCI